MRGLVTGEVRCDDVFLQLYASDASIYQVRPLGVVRPRSKSDVVALVRYCQEHQLPIHARGAGTGLVGQSLGPGIIADFSVHFRRVVWTGADEVRVQPGVVHERLNQHLAGFGRVFGPDPAMSHVTTMGSVVAVNGSGSRWPRFGAARDHLRSLEVVLADGTLVEAGREPLVGGVSKDPHDRKRDLINQLADLLRRNRGVLEAHRPKVNHNSSGYHVWDILTDDYLDLHSLLCGSEGTLALTTELTVATQVPPRARAMALLYFDRLESAARAVADIRGFDPASCDLLDRRHLSLARETNERYEALIPPAAEAALIVELDGDLAAEVRDRVRLLVDRVRRRRRYAFDARIAFHREEMDLYWRLSQKVVPTLYRLRGSTRAIPGIEDLAVPPDAVAKFFVDLQNVLKKHQVTASLYGHVAHGQLHLRPFLDLTSPADLATLEALAGDLYELVLATGGTIAGEHGDGLSRTGFVRRQYGDAWSVFREIKRIFDPLNLLNPGKIVGEEGTLLSSRVRPPLARPTATADRAEVTSHPAGSVAAISPTGAGADVQADEPSTGVARRELPVLGLQLHWGPGELQQMARTCNGCGACRSQSREVRMCPIFRILPSEEASPRAKANLLRGVLSGELDASAIESDEFKQVADLCVNCHQCRLECPASVDIPRMMIEAKAQHVATNGLSLAETIVTRLDLLGWLGSRFSPVYNWGIANRWVRWGVEKAVGIAQQRKLPRISARPFMRRAARRRLTRPSRRAGAKVLYFVDTYANYHDPQLGEALVAVMEHNGIGVYVHPDQQPSGMAMISHGVLEPARRLARRNVAILAEAIRQGYTIVSTEPSSVLCLTIEYPEIFDDEDARLVAQHTTEACAYLWQLHLAGKLVLKLRPIHSAVGYHLPCHVKALGPHSPGENLLRLIPGLQVHPIDRGCSGMAGTYGLRRENYRASLRAGWGLISAIRDAQWQAGATECSACKMQMEQGTSKPTIHPLKLLAHAYGLMPEVASLLGRRGEELVIT